MQFMSLNKATGADTKKCKLYSLKKAFNVGQNINLKQKHKQTKSYVKEMSEVA